VTRRKLTDLDVIAIRRLRRGYDWPYRELAARFGVSAQAVRDAAQGLTHADVDEPVERPRGPRTRYPPALVRAARQAYLRGWALSAIAARFGVSIAWVDRVARHQLRDDVV